LQKQKIREILETISHGGVEYLEFEAEGKTYIRKFAPKERLIVLGGGHVSQPICHIAGLLGFAVTVVDDRPMFANSRNFPDVEHIVCDGFRKAISELNITENDYVVIVTRGHRWDAECLREILPGTFPGYLGMMGSRRRVHELFELLKGEGYRADLIEKIHSPIGLEIKALTPAEIAVSVCAELVLHRRTHLPAEDKEILEQSDADKNLLEFLLDDSMPKAFVTVLSTRGSTPAKSGAVMAVDRMGVIRGTVGGGCSEAELITKARQNIGTGERLIVDVRLTSDIAEEEGMVCGGVMRALVEDVTD